MKSVVHSCPRPFLTFVLVLCALLAAPALLAAEEAPAISDQAVPAKAELAAPVDSLGLPMVAFASSKRENNFNCIRCVCRDNLTQTATRVGATCLRARQRAAAAARALAVCPPGSTSCGPVTHTVAPCVPITNGFSATATATYACETCINICQ